MKQITSNWRSQWVKLSDDFCEDRRILLLFKCIVDHISKWSSKEIRRSRQSGEDYVASYLHFCTFIMNDTRAEDHDKIKIHINEYCSEQVILHGFISCTLRNWYYRAKDYKDDSIHHLWFIRISNYRHVIVNDRLVTNVKRIQSIWIKIIISPTNSTHSAQDKDEIQNYMSVAIVKKSELDEYSRVIRSISKDS